MRTDEEVRVLIVSAYRPLRDALRWLLENEGISVVGDASTAREGIVLARSLSPHVAVLDEQLPDGDAHTLNAQLHASASPTRCIILTSWHPPAATPPAPGDPILLVRQIADHGLPTAIRAAAREEPAASEFQVRRPSHADPTRSSGSGPAPIAAHQGRFAVLADPWDQRSASAAGRQGLCQG